MSESYTIHYAHAIDVVVLPVREVLSPPFRPEFCAPLLAILSSHQCQVNMAHEVWRISFPEGTTRREIFPRVQNERYILTLPDGYVMHETIMRSNGFSCLRFNVTDLPQETREKHRELIEQLMLF